KALPLLKKGASVIFTTSVANEIGMATSTVYAGTKAAVRSLARTMSGELVAKGIRVNAVSPGPIQTPIFGRMGMTADQASDMAKNIAAQVPLGRIGASEEVARTAVFLA